jgi:hypothetical protein
MKTEFLPQHKSVMKKIIIEADFLDFPTLKKMLKKVLNDTSSGKEFGFDIPFENYVKQKVIFKMEYKSQKNFEEKEINGEIHKIIKSKL